MLKPDPYDPEQAKKLLSEAGYPNGFDTTVMDYGGGSIQTQFNAAVAGYWQKIGVRAVLKPGDLATAPRGNAPEKWNSFRSVLSQGVVFQAERLYVGYHSKGYSSPDINNPTLDALLERIPTIRDQAEKKRVALEAAVMGRNEYSTIAILDLHTLIALSSKVGGITPIRGLVGLPSVVETASFAK
ncbi:MAG: hypothetical protein HYX94_00485 [Chloroflexi bacterium]|nr:hypothetical protein [Chloroflexota bacterium]